MEAVVFVGVQGSGKSTFFARHYADTHVRLNRDMLRTGNREAVLMHACLAVGQAFVIDNTNPKRDTRARYVAAAKAAGFRTIVVVFSVPLELALARNAAREAAARVSEIAIRGTFAKLEAVTDDEGFDEVRTVTEAA
ncbi:AAA family ATPase [Enhygromyxa salina]|nr:AAA family ATPase [Enhygromyxa salina]